MLRLITLAAALATLPGAPSTAGAAPVPEPAASPGGVLAPPISRASAARPPVADAPRYERCMALVRTDPAAAATDAAAYRLSGGGIAARHCLGAAMAARGDAAAARAELEAAARDAEAAHHPLAPALWGQAGNAALLAADPLAARADLTRALETGTAIADQAGWRIDRARASVALAATASAPTPMLNAARNDLDTAIALTPSDPVAHLLSAALARRMGDPARARAAIAQAQRLAPDDPEVRAEAARVAALRST